MSWLISSLIIIIGIFIMRSLNSRRIFYLSFGTIVDNSKDLHNFRVVKHVNVWEIYCIRDCDDLGETRLKRPGLEMIKLIYKYLPEVKSRLTSKALSPELKTLMKTWKALLTIRHAHSNPWHLANMLGSSQSLINVSSEWISDILYAMKTYRVTFSDIGYKGTQLKLLLTLNGGQKVIFKPKRSTIHEVFKGVIYAGTDRHQGEIVAFHLALLLNMTSAPIVVGRKFSLKKQILSVASKQLLKTVSFQGKRTCFYGECHFCRREYPACDDGAYIDGALILWIPDHLRLVHFTHPWVRTYNRDKLARWETNKNFCRELSPSLFHRERRHILLNLVDVSIFDFLIQNGDRHHFSVVANDPRSAVIMLDNGKSFGDPLVDHLDVLAPLFQCCRIRQRTYERLRLLSGGGLSKALDELLYTDPLYPVISVLHLKALDRRVNFILAAVEACRYTVGKKLFL